MSKTYYVYIMASQLNGTLHTGVTSDLTRRVSQHRQGTIPGFSQEYKCKTLVWFEQHSDIAEAILREKQIKSWRRAWKLRLIEADNRMWNELLEESIS